MPTVLITGASRGLGLEFARQYAAEGWHVVAACRSSEKARELRALSASFPSVRIMELDVTRAVSIAALADALKDDSLDLLINNAGVVSATVSCDHRDYHMLPGQKFGALDPAEWLAVLNVNALAPLMVTQAVLPRLLSGKAPKVVMISSRYGSLEAGYPDFIAYSSSKAALNMGMRKAALALKDKGVIVVSLNPGWVRTDMGGAEADITPETSVAGMRKVIDGLTLEQSGGFYRYTGETLPW